jgi:hypothetical protein
MHLLTHEWYWSSYKRYSGLLDFITCMRVTHVLRKLLVIWRQCVRVLIPDEHHLEILLQVSINIIRGRKKSRYVKKLLAHYNAWTELNWFPALKEVITSVGWLLETAPNRVVLRVHNHVSKQIKYPVLIYNHLEICQFFTSSFMKPNGSLRFLK